MESMWGANVVPNFRVSFGGMILDVSLDGVMVRAEALIHLFGIWFNRWFDLRLRLWIPVLSSIFIVEAVFEVNLNCEFN